MAWTLHGPALRRPLGDSEYAFVPSATKEGLGDMFLHLAFRAPKSQMGTHRITLAWTILRLKHLLLMARVITASDEFMLEFRPPESSQAAIESAKTSLIIVANECRESMILGYMNGPRALSNDQLSRLTISTSFDPDSYDLLMCAPHFIGDGTALHQTTNELLEILSSGTTDQELEGLIEDLCKENWIYKLPPPMEERLPSLNNRWAKSAAKVNFEQTMYKEIGGQSFSRVNSPLSKTLFLERSYTTAQTSEILKKCKSNGVTVNHAIFSLCNIAWSKVKQKEVSTHWKTLPLMVYSAINLRPYLSPHSSSSTPWFIALTYFNVVIPSFPPEQSPKTLTDKVFWSRAADIKSQIRRTTQSTFLLDRAKEMGRRRAWRAGRPSACPSAAPVTLSIGKKEGCREDAVLDPAPSNALLGLSLIGNLDSVYKGQYNSESSGFVLRNVTTASRLKPGGLLLLSHTFRGQLWFQLFFDVNGFQKNSDGKTEVEEFWDAIGDAVDEYLLP